MNFLDPYDISNSTPSPTAEGQTPPAQPQPQQTLEEEVTQVIGQLGGFWGRIRQQSQAALQTARKDFGDVVVQAQKEIGKYTATAESSSTTASSSTPALPTDGESTTRAAPSTDSEGVDSTATPQSSSTYQTLFSRFQSALPPNLVSTVQSSIPESVKHASENIDFAQWRTTLATEFQRVQGVTRAQAEEYVKKSEAVLRETMKEAGEALKDAVKIIPPDEGTLTSASSSGAIWDGSDIWMLPSYDSSESALSSKGKGKEISASSSSGSLGDVQRVATRAESLLKRLRDDPEIIKHEPDATPFSDWVKTEVESREGIDSEYWKKKIAEERSTASDEGGLDKTYAALVPSTIDDATFWKRYFFRVNQIRKEEEKRKALLQATEHEDDFSWEDEEDEGNSTISEHHRLTPTMEPPSKTAELEATPKGHTKSSSKDTNVSSPQLLTPAGTSPRGSEDGSYDVVSSSNASSAAGDNPKRTKEEEQDLSDGDSDWE